jgi:hypothetical protein
MQFLSNARYQWYSGEHGADSAECERLARRISEAFAEPDLVEFNDIDGIPSVEFAFFRKLMTPSQVLDIGRRLKEVVGEYPVRFQQLRAGDVVFLVVHELGRDGHPFREGHVDDYGVPFEELEKAWSNQDSSL